MFDLLILACVAVAVVLGAVAVPPQPNVPSCSFGTTITVAQYVSDPSSAQSQIATSTYDGQLYRIDTYFSVAGNAPQMLQTAIHNQTTDTLITDFLNGTVTCQQGLDNSNMTQSWPPLKFGGTAVFRGESVNVWTCTNCQNAQYDLKLLTKVSANDIAVFSELNDHTSGIVAQTTFVQQLICTHGTPSAPPSTTFDAPSKLGRCASNWNLSQRRRSFSFSPIRGPKMF
jgi:hypothetical protein